jgi:hypothetical protein
MPARTVTVTESSQTEDLQLGDVVHCKVRSFVWTEHHLRGSELESCVLAVLLCPAPS